MGRFSKLETQTRKAAAAVQDLPAPKQGAEPLTFDGMMREAELRFHGGDYVKALRWYSQALSEDNTRQEPWVGQVFALLLQSQYREATVWAQRAVTVFPNDPLILSLHGLAFAMQGMAKRGLATSDYGMSQGSTDPRCWVARGWILLESENENWRMCFARAADVAQADQWRVHMLMGLILERYRKWVNAIEHYEAAVNQHTGSFFLWHRLGVCQARLGLARRAFEAQEHALNLKPGYAPAERELRRLGGFPIGAMFAWIRNIFSRPKPQ